MKETTSARIAVTPYVKLLMAEAQKKASVESAGEARGISQALDFILSTYLGDEIVKKVKKNHAKGIE